MAIVTIEGSDLIVVISGPRIRTRLSFDSAPQLEHWAIGQAQDWINEATKVLSVAGAAGIQLQSAVFEEEKSAFNNLSERARNPGSPPNWVTGEIKQVFQNIADRVEAGELLIYGTEIANRIVNLKAEDNEAYVIAAMFSSKQNLNNYRIRTMAGTNGVSLKSLGLAIGARYPAPPSESDVQDAVALRAERDVWRDEIKALRDQHAQVAAMHQDAQALDATYREQMKLRAPVTYWTARGNALTKATWRAGVFFGVLVIAYALLAWLFFLPLIQDLHADQTMDPKLLILDIAVVTLPSLAFFWVLRMIARIFNHSLARGADAHERATLINAYLALCETTATTPSETERLVLIRAISRPGPGDSLDEVAPDTILDQLLASFKPK